MPKKALQIILSVVIVVATKPGSVTENVRTSGPPGGFHV